jgi:hypothetical protein
VSGSSAPSPCNCGSHGRPTAWRAQQAAAAAQGEAAPAPPVVLQEQAAEEGAAPAEATNGSSGEAMDVRDDAGSPADEGPQDDSGSEADQ